MAYVVTGLDDLYDFFDGQGNNETRSAQVARWLNTQEEDGYSLVGIIPDHKHWEENSGPGLPGPVGTMLIMHKQDEEPPGDFRIIN